MKELNVRLTLDGPPGSGKSSVANAIRKLLEGHVWPATVNVRVLELQTPYRPEVTEYTIKGDHDDRAI